MLTAECQREMLRTMVRIRVFEERLKAFYDYRGFYADGAPGDAAEAAEDLLTCVLYDFEKSGMIGGAVHLYIGEEAVATGVCAALKDGDFVTSTHRGHGHAIAMGLSLDRILAELMGRESGYSRGFGGSMHIFSLEDGVLGGNGIVGGGIPIALGPAFAAKYLGSDGVCVGFFGDGAANQGTFHESLNMAALWGLPVVYVCENNLWAASTAAEITLATPDVAVRAGAYGIPGVVVDGMDVRAVYEAATQAVSRARAGGGPTLIEAKTFRFEGHAGGGKGRHRDPEAVRVWRERDPIALLGKSLADGGLMSAVVREGLRAEAEAEMDRAVEAAKGAALPPVELLEASVLPSTPATPAPVTVRSSAPAPPSFRGVRELSYAAAVAEGVREEMERDATVFLMGEDIGPVRSREGLWDAFRERRVWQTPMRCVGSVGRWKRERCIARPRRATRRWGV